MDLHSMPGVVIGHYDEVTRVEVGGHSTLDDGDGADLIEPGDNLVIIINDKLIN